MPAAELSQLHTPKLGTRSLDVLTEDTNSILFPDLDPAMVAKVLGRTRRYYSSPDEQEAEIIASLILQQANRVTPTPGPTIHSDVAERIEHSLD